MTTHVEDSVRLQPGQVLQIRKWPEVFEKSDAKKMKVLTWVSMPVGFDSNGLQMLFDDFPPVEAVALYGAWCMLVKVAARARERGRLGGSQGKAYSTAALSRLTMGVPVELLDTLIAWCVNRSGWLEIVRVGEPCESPQTPDLPANSCVSENLRESPDYRTGPDRTQQDITGRPEAPARPEFLEATKQEANSTAERICDALKITIARLTARNRLAIWRTACWLSGRADAERLLDEICAVLREQRPDRPDRMLFTACRARDGSADFSLRWDACQLPQQPQSVSV